MLRILFLGTPEFALRTLDAVLGSPHEVVGIVTQPDRPRGRGQRLAPPPVKVRGEAAGLPVFQPERLKDEGLLDALRQLRPDLGVVAAYGRLIPRVLLELPRLGMVNVHASLLPKYRGAAPIARAIMDGARETGVTIMRVVAALDAGPMLAASRTPIDPDETGETLERRLGEIGAQLLVETLDPIERGHAVETPQDDGQATYAPRILKADGLIDWEAPAGAIHDKVRALVPWPHAFTFLEGQRLVLHETHAHVSLAAAVGATAGTPLDQPPARVTPGVVASAHRTLLVGAGGETVVEVRRLQEEGRKVVTSREYLAGRPIPPGTRLSATEAA